MATLMQSYSSIAIILSKRQCSTIMHLALAFGSPCISHFSNKSCSASVRASISPRAKNPGIYQNSISVIIYKQNNIFNEKALHVQVQEPKTSRVVQAFRWQSKKDRTGPTDDVPHGW